MYIELASRLFGTRTQNRADTQVVFQYPANTGNNLGEIFGRPYHTAFPAHEVATHFQQRSL
jgi:hypothetical protein